MKHIKRIIDLFTLNIFLCFNVLNSQSQQVVPGSGELLSKLRLNKNAGGIEKVTYSNIDGDPFIYRDFIPGRMILKNGEIYSLNLRYDIYTSKIQFKDKDEIFEIINQEKLALIVIDTITFQYSNYLKSPGEANSVENSWFILKTDGKCKLFIKKNIRIQDAELPKPYQEAKPAKFIHTSDTYYLKPEDKSAVRIDNKKDLLNIFTDKKDQITEFINSNKLGVKEVYDLVKIISFYNSL
jgi:hypothetical protein